MARILKNFCDLKRFLDVNSGVTCRLKCGKCQKKWSATGTEFVSRMEMTVQEKGKPVAKIYYICTTCVQEIEKNGLETQVKSDCK